MRFLAALTAVVVTGCLKETGNHEPKTVQANEACKPYMEIGAHCRISLTNLIVTPERYIGVDVVFTGFLAGGGLPGRIFLSRESWRLRDEASSVVLVPSRANFELIRAQGDAMKYNYVSVMGKVDWVRTARAPYVAVVPERISLVHQERSFSSRENRMILEEKSPR